VNRLLVVVGEASPETVRQALEGRPAKVHVVATTVVGALAWLSNAEEDARLRAEMRALEAEQALEGLVEVTSAAADIDPVDAVDEALAGFPADEIAIAGSAADPGLEQALAGFGLPVVRLGPPPARGARVNRELRQLAGGRDPGKLVALIVGMNVAVLAAAIVLSLFAILILWLVGAY
jgi:hypothetical protein